MGFFRSQDLYHRKTAHQKAVSLTYKALKPGVRVCSHELFTSFFSQLKPRFELLMIIYQDRRARQVLFGTFWRNPTQYRRYPQTHL